MPMVNYEGTDDGVAMTYTTTSKSELVSRVAFVPPSIEDAARGEYEFRLTRRRRRSSPSSSIAVVVTPQALSHRQAAVWGAGVAGHPRRPRPRALVLDGVEARRRR